MMNKGERKNLYGPSPGLFGKEKGKGRKEMPNAGESREEGKSGRLVHHLPRNRKGERGKKGRGGGGRAVFPRRGRSVLGRGEPENGPAAINLRREGKKKRKGEGHENGASRYPPEKGGRETKGAPSCHDHLPINYPAVGKGEGKKRKEKGRPCSCHPR